MKIISLLSNIFSNYLCLICISIIITLSGCYSFTGGSIPEHLNTLYIATVEDNSGFGNPNYRDKLSQQLFEVFRDDNSFELVENGGDARLSVSISSIRDETLTVGSGGSQRGELETERKITVTCKAEYFDAVKNKEVWNKSFSNFGTYEIANAQTGRDEAVDRALEQTAEDIMLAVVSGW